MDIDRILRKAEQLRNQSNQEQFESMALTPYQEKIQRFDVNWEMCINPFLLSLAGSITSESTRETYRVAIESWIRFVSERGVVAPTAKDFAEYIIWLKSRLKPASVNLYLIVMRKFFRFLQSQHIYADLSEKVEIRFERVDPMRRNTVRDEDATKLLEVVDQEYGHKGDRDKLIIETALYSGLRVSEIASLRKEDVINDASVYKLMPLRKGRRQRSIVDSVFICAELYDKLQEYIQKYKIENYIFCDWRYVQQKHISGAAVSDIITAYLRKAGIKREDVTPHSLRHWYLTKYYQMSKDIFLTQRQAGHSSIDSTLVYMHPSLRRDTPVLEMRR